MTVLLEIANNLLVEQDDKLSVLRKGIGERIPVSIYYTGPTDEVRAGQRLDIEPIILGKNAKSGNLVIWAYVFKGISKKGIPGWKMFRVDRITSAKLNPNDVHFELGSLPGYEKGKAPSAMKSLSSVEIFSPYWFEDDERFAKMAKAFPKKVPKPEITRTKPTRLLPPAPEPGPVTQPTGTIDVMDTQVFNNLKARSRDINGQKYISTQDYNNAIQDLATNKEDEWKVYERQISGNIKPGEGTRQRFMNTAKLNIDKLLGRENIQINDNPQRLAEAYRVKSRIKRLIIW